jgi:hypothetical protein
MILEGRGFSPAEIAAPALYSPRTPRGVRELEIIMTALQRRG